MKLSDGETCQNVWDVIGLRLRKTLAKVEEGREYAIASILKEEVFKRNFALQAAASEHAKVLEESKNDHLVDLDVQIKLANEEVRREDRIEKHRLKEIIYELKSTMVQIKQEACAKAECVRISTHASFENARTEADAKAGLERDSWRKSMTKYGATANVGAVITAKIEDCHQGVSDYKAIADTNDGADKETIADTIDGADEKYCKAVPIEAIETNHLLNLIKAKLERFKMDPLKGKYELSFNKNQQLQSENFFYRYHYSRFVKALVHLLVLATLCSMKQVHDTREC